jgi:hypothetical protein
LNFIKKQNVWVLMEKDTKNKKEILTWVTKAQVSSSLFF